MPRPRSLTTDQIAEAALAVVDADGLGALSMRAVARRLDVGTMSLYRYVSDRTELEQLVVDLVVRRVDLGPSRGGAGRRLTALAEGVRAAVADHPGVAPLLLTHRHRLAGSLQWGEAVLRVLTDAGFDGRRRAVAFRAVLAHVFGAVQIEHFGALSGPGTAALAELSRDDFPLLADTAADARRISPSEEFRRGFEILLRGLDL